MAQLKMTKTFQRKKKQHKTTRSFCGAVKLLTAGTSFQQVFILAYFSFLGNLC